MKKIEQLAMLGIRQWIREILKERPHPEDVIEFLDMEDHFLLTVTVKLWKEQEAYAESVIETQAEHD